jgi:RNA polymerase sigma-70 factor (ECF subfamily)
VDYAMPLQAERILVDAMSSECRKFVALLEAHGPSLVAMLRRLCRNPHDADDVYQDTAVRVWKHFGSRPVLRNPRSWLMTIAYRAFVDHYERRQPSEPVLDLADSRTAPPERQAEASEWSGRVHAAIEDLAQPLRQVVLLHYAGGLTLRETATAMSLSIGTVKSRLNTALQSLRSLLE